MVWPSGTPASLRSAFALARSGLYHFAWSSSARQVPVAEAEGDRPGHRRPAREYLLDDLLAVGGEGQGLARAWVAPRLPLPVDDEGVEIRARPAADDDARVAPEPLDALGGEEAVVQAAGAEAGDARVLLLQDPERHLVEVGEGLAPVVRVLAELDVTLRHILDETVRAGADHLGLELELLHRALGNDGRAPQDGEGAQKRRERGLGDEAHRVPVDDLDLVHLVEVAPPEGRALRVENDVEGVLDVLGRELAAIVELDAAAEVEDVRGRIRRVPSLGQRGNDLRLGVERGEALVAMLEALRRGEVGVRDRIERHGVGLRRPDRDPTRLRRSAALLRSCGAGAHQRRRDAEGGRRREPLATRQVAVVGTCAALRLRHGASPSPKTTRGYRAVDLAAI